MTDAGRNRGTARKQHVWSVLGVYAVGSWVALQVVDVLADNLGLPSWFFLFALGLLVLGIPVALAIGLRGGGADARDESRASLDDNVGAARMPSSFWRTAGGVGVAALAIWGAAVGVWLVFGVARSGSSDASIAVLPFDNLSASESDYFASGVHEDILTQLSKIGSLRVISRTSVLGYRPGEQTAREVGEALGVSTILEGSVRHDPANNRVRLVVQLIDAQTDDHIWADNYDRTLDDVFEIQSELALMIAQELRTTLLPEEERRITERQRPTTEAYDLVLRGRELYALGAARNQAAIRFFRLATDADPTSAEAWAELSNTLGQQLQLGTASTADRDSQLVYAQRAVELDPDLSLAYRALGFAHSTAGRGQASEAAYTRALELSPNYVPPMVNLSGRLWNRGRCDEGIRIAIRAYSLSPLDPFPAGHVGDHNTCLGRWEEALRWIERAREIEPDWIWADFFEALYGLGFGLDEQAEAIVDRFVARDPSEPVALLLASERAVLQEDFVQARDFAIRLLAVADPDWYFMRGSALATATRDFAMAALGEPVDQEELWAAIARSEERVRISGDGPYATKALPILHAVAGDLEAAIRWLERAAEQSGAAQIGRFERDPRLAPIRNDPRFAAALDAARRRVESRRAGVEAWEAETDPYGRRRQ